MHKYHRTIIGETIMPDLCGRLDLQESLTAHDEPIDGWLLAQRELLAAALTDIAFKVRTALDDAGLPIEVFFTVPSSGEALLTVATPYNPSNPNWAQANEIICAVIGHIIGQEGLHSRCLSCAGSGVSMGAAPCLPPDHPVIRMPPGGS